MGKLEIILSTGNIVSGGSNIVRKPGTSRSNLEFTTSLQDHFVTAQQDYATTTKGGQKSDSTLEVWTAKEGNTLYIPRIEWLTAGLQEEPGQYEITVKLFFLPFALVSERAQYVRSAVGLVLQELKVDAINLLIASFPGMSFDGDCEWEADKKNALQGDIEEELATWEILEDFHHRGIVKNLGIAEFGSEKLKRFMSKIKVKPSVDQINIRDCCNVPPPLIELANSENIELLVHTDCTDILPKGTLRELLGPKPKGAGVLSEPTSHVEELKNDSVGLDGDLVPQWVVKYTAVVRDRGVIENKGYFAGAILLGE